MAAPVTATPDPTSDKPPRCGRCIATSLRVYLVILIVVAFSGAAHAQQADKGQAQKEQVPASARKKVEPEDLSDWRISVALGPQKFERTRWQWHEIEIGSDGQCRADRAFLVVDKPRRMPLFADRLTEGELKAVLAAACAAVSEGPPERKEEEAKGADKLLLKLTSGTDSYSFEAADLTNDLRGAGPEIGKLILIVNGHLRSDERSFPIWSPPQVARLRGKPKLEFKDVGEWRLEIRSFADSPEGIRSSSWRYTVRSNGSCRIERSANRITKVEFEGMRTEEELTPVLQLALDAINNGPPRRAQGFAEDGWKYELTLQTPAGRHNAVREGLPDRAGIDAGPEIPKLIDLLNRYSR